VTDDEIKNFLRASITAKRVIVVPLHLDTTKIVRQVAELIKQGIDVTVAKVKSPRCAASALRLSRRPDGQWESPV
jgi:hypothetical protein